MTDQLTKNLISREVSQRESVSVIDGLFNIIHIYNPGASFGLLSQFTEARTILTLVSFFAIILLFFLLFRSKTKGALTHFGFALILGGALGNLADRLMRGRVLDWLDFYYQGAGHYPAFNLADVYIVTGVGILFLNEFFLAKERLLEPKRN